MKQKEEEKRRESHVEELKKKKIRGYLLLTALLLAAGLILFQIQYIRFRDKELSENQRNVNTVAEVIGRLNSAKESVSGEGTATDSRGTLRY